MRSQISQHWGLIFNAFGISFCPYLLKGLLVDLKISSFASLTSATFSTILDSSFVSALGFVVELDSEMFLGFTGF